MALHIRTNIVEIIHKAYADGTKQRGRFPFSLKQKLENQCLEFAKQCRIAGVNIREAVIWSCDFYDDKVCRKIFKRPFPPLNVVIGKKSIERLSLFKKGTKKEKVTKSLVNLYWNAIACLDKKEAIALIDGGWLSDHKELAKKLRNRLVKTGSN